MAEHLASIFGTEKDRVNCPFYIKIGACRHGDRCSRLHNRPTISPTILLHNLYMNPVLNAPLGADGLPVPVDPSKVQQFFEDFYEDIFLELDRFGEVEHLCVCDNLADHMVGNVYVKFRDERDAAAAVQGLAGRFYAGKPIQVEFSPVTDFRESTCRQYEEGTCGRGGYCNFMHVRPVAKDLRIQLFGRYKGGSGGSTRFHDGAGRRGDDRRRGGYGGGGGGGRRDRYDDRRGGSRYDRDRDYDRRGSRYDNRDRDRRGGGGGGGGGGGYEQQRETSAERRARIAAWSADAPAQQPAYQGYAAPPAAPGGVPLPPPAPAVDAGAYGSYAAPAQQQHVGYGSYAAPPVQQQQPYYGGGGGGGGGAYGRGGSGANTIPIAGMRTFPDQHQQQQ